MPDSTDAHGRGRQDPVTGLYEWYHLEYQVARATSDKLQNVLNSLAEDGQELVSAHFQGGRDWTVISRRVSVTGQLADGFYAIRNSGLRGVEALETLRAAGHEPPR